MNEQPTTQNAQSVSSRALWYEMNMSGFLESSFESNISVLWYWPHAHEQAALC